MVNAVRLGDLAVNMLSNPPRPSIDVTSVDG